MTYQQAFFGFAAEAAPPVPVEKTGNISSNETWSGIIHITGDVFILTTVEVTVAAGTQVLFKEDYKIECHGQFQAVGTVSNRISFKNHVDNVTGSWFGIIMGEEVDAFNINPPDATAFFKFQYCDFEDGDKGSRETIGHRGRKRGGALMAEDVRGGLTIDNNTFLRCKAQENGGAIFIQVETPFNQSYTVSNCTFTDCDADTDANGGWLGGGLMCAHPDTMTMTSNTYVNCTAGTDFEDVPVTVDHTVDEITTPVAHDLQTGSSIKLGGTTVPSPLVAGTEYYAIVTSSTKLKVATTIANANSSTAVDLTDNGTAVTGTVHYDWYMFDVQTAVVIT